MARFFFHILNGSGLIEDEDGLDLESQAAAHSIAIDSVRSIIAEEARQGMIDLKGQIVVKDEGGHILTTVEFADAFELHVPESVPR